MNSAELQIIRSAIDDLAISDLAISDLAINDLAISDDRKSRKLNGCRTLGLGG